MISMVFRRNLINEVGFFHAVRWGADREFIRRVESIKGAQQIVVLEADLMSSRLREGSLTMQAGSEFFRYSKRTKEFKVRPSAARLQYQDQYEALHKKINDPKDLREEFPFAPIHLYPVLESQRCFTIEPDQVALRVMGDQSSRHATELVQTMEYLKTNLKQVTIQAGAWRDTEINIQSGWHRYLLVVDAQSPLSISDLRLLLATALSRKSTPIIIGRYHNKRLEILAPEDFEDATDIASLVKPDQVALIQQIL
jgi:hypothetical protein